MSETPDERRARLRAIGIKGGEATKAKLATDPDYYKRVASMGGHASRNVPKGGSRKRKEPGVIKPRRAGAVQHAQKNATAPKKPQPTTPTRTIPNGTVTAFDDLDAFMRSLAE